MAQQALMLDIADETQPTGTMIHHNRSFHRMADRLSPRLGTKGNYLKDAKQQLDKKVQNITLHLNQTEQIHQTERKFRSLKTNLNNSSITLLQSLNRTNKMQHTYTHN